MEGLLRMLNNPTLLALFLQLWEPGFDSFGSLPEA
jgi:hypothetical protein